MSVQPLSVERDPPVVRVTFSRPDKLNAISGHMQKRMQELCAELRDDTETRVVILTGAGRAFSAGVDVEELGGALGKQRDPMRARLGAQMGSRTAAAWESLDQVTIAAINGLCVGGAVVLALCCDIRLAAESAWFSIPEVSLGIPLTWNALPRLMREVGPARALELVTTCDRFSAQQALEWGMVNHVLPDGDLLGAAEGLAQKIASRPALAVALTKAQIRALKRGTEIGEATYSDPELLMLAGMIRQSGAESDEQPSGDAEEINPDVNLG